MTNLKHDMPAPTGHSYLVAFTSPIVAAATSFEQAAVALLYRSISSFPEA